MFELSNAVRRSGHRSIVVTTMATLTIHGLPHSPYVRTVRMTCAEKGVDHELRPVDPGSEHHRSLHPFARMPILEHGDVRIFETRAIVRYLDAAFAGASLVPSHPRALATMEQWMSVHDGYLYADLIDGYAAARRSTSSDGGRPDRAAIDRILPAVERDFDLLDRALAGRSWIAGGFSLADLLLAPMIATVAPLPEAGAILERTPDVRRWLAAMRQRPSAPLLSTPRPPEQLWRPTPTPRRPTGPRAMTSPTWFRDSPPLGS